MSLAINAMLSLLHQSITLFIKPVLVVNKYVNKPDVNKYVNKSQITPSLVSGFVSLW